MSFVSGGEPIIDRHQLRSPSLRASSRKDRVDPVTVAHDQRTRRESQTATGNVSRVDAQRITSALMAQSPTVL